MITERGTLECLDSSLLRMSDAFGVSRHVVGFVFIFFVWFNEFNCLALRIYPLESQ